MATNLWIKKQTNQSMINHIIYYCSSRKTSTLQILADIHKYTTFTKGQNFYFPVHQILTRFTMNINIRAGQTGGVLEYTPDHDL